MKPLPNAPVGHWTGDDGSGRMTSLLFCVIDGEVIVVRMAWNAMARRVVRGTDMQSNWKHVRIRARAHRCQVIDAKTGKTLRTLASPDEAGTTINFMKNVWRVFVDATATRIVAVESCADVAVWDFATGDRTARLVALLVRKIGRKGGGVVYWLVGCIQFHSPVQINIVSFFNLSVIYVSEHDHDNMIK